MRTKNKLLNAQADRLPRLAKDGAAAKLFVDGKPFIVLGGEVQNSSASSAEFMEGIWDRMAAFNCNTVLAPAYWELIEPSEGKFDFSLVDEILQGARKRALRLVLLWFGTWKNAESSYVPAWLKQDLARFPRAQLRARFNGRAISPFSQEACRADARAFARLLRHLREKDRRHTVIMLQVENEAGLLGGARDFSEPAEKAFTSPVPAGLMKGLAEKKRALAPALAHAWSNMGGKTSGTWSEVFGAMADEAFMAWHVASYIERVAAAGKAEYPLPMYTNAWLNGAGDEAKSSAPGSYPSGGPVAKVHDLWRIAAPSLDALAPDIYCPDFKAVCADFARNGNPLLIPETGPAGANARVFWAVGEHGAVCFSPFGIDSPHCWGPACPMDSPGLAESYALLQEMLPALAPHLGASRIRGILQTSDGPSWIEIGDYRAEITYAAKLDGNQAPGFGLAAAIGAHEFLVAGRGFAIRFHPPEGKQGTVDFLSVEEGRFVDGKWKPRRRLNGDDTVDCRVTLKHEPDPVARRVVVYQHL